MNYTARQAVQFVERYNAPIIGDRLIPFLLMVVGFFPISISLVIALESFVGEKERHSIEPLLSSPLSDVQLYLGKLLAAMVPPLLASYLGILVYLIGVYYRIGWTPEPILLIQIIMLTTVQAILMVSGAVVVSTQTTSVRAANLLSSFIIIPMAFLIQGESIIMFWARYHILWWAIAGQLVIAGLLIRTGLAYFNREELLGRELDTLDLKWAWRLFKRSFTGRQSSLVTWYRYQVFPLLAGLRLPLLIAAISIIIGIYLGVDQADTFAIPAELLTLDNINQGFIQGLDSIRFFSAAGVGAIWLHNLRVIALATILGLFSFGVLGLLVLLLPIALIAYLTANVAAAGISPALFLGGLVIPHGILEFPAILITGAAVLKLGATLAAPAKNITIGEAMILSFAEWAKVIIGIVLPLFLMAAVVEVFVTPHIAVWLLG